MSSSNFSKIEPLFHDGETEKEFFDRILGALRSVTNGVPIKDRSYHLRTFERCFVAEEAVSWLARHLITTDRAQMVAVLEMLRQRGDLVHVTDASKPFTDEYLFFRFTRLRRVVVVGGGFAGLSVVKKLPRKHYDVTLVDDRDHFVCTPSLPFCVCDPAHIRKITSPFDSFVKNATIVQGRMAALHSDSIELQDGTELGFDFCVLATGSHYDIPSCLHSDDVDTPTVVNPMHHGQLLASFERLQASKAVCVVGGGPTGLEIAGEIAAAYPRKKVTVVVSRQTMLDRLAPEAHKSCVKYFKNFENMEVLLGERVAGLRPGVLYTDKGTEVECGVVYCGVGFTPNTEFLAPELREERTGLAKVDMYLRLTGSYNVFAIGDICNVKEEKLAQAAEAHAALTVCNIAALDKQQPLQPYSPKNFFIIISLGPSKAVCVKGDSVIIDGSLTRKMKNLVEYKLLFDK